MLSSVYGVVLTLLALFATSSSLGAQATTSQRCPTVRVSGPDTVNSGEMIQFKAVVSGGDSEEDPLFNWTVSNGTIQRGQGTPAVDVNTTDMIGNAVTATVAVLGFPRSCRTDASSTTSVITKMVAQKVDEYPSVEIKGEATRLDNFALELLKDPVTQAYIFAYGGRRGRKGEAETVGNRAKAYLISKRGIDATRIVTVDGGYREHLAVELWLVPSGSTPPLATPTVDPNEVKLTKPAPKKRSKRTRTM